MMAWGMGQCVTLCLFVLSRVSISGWGFAVADQTYRTYSIKRKKINNRMRHGECVAGKLWFEVMADGHIDEFQPHKKMMRQKDRNATQR